MHFWGGLFPLTSCKMGWSSKFWTLKQCQTRPIWLLKWLYSPPQGHLEFQQKHGVSYKPFSAPGFFSDLPTYYVKIAIEQGPFIASFPIVVDGKFPWFS